VPSGHTLILQQKRLSIVCQMAHQEYRPLEKASYVTRTTRVMEVGAHQDEAFALSISSGSQMGCGEVRKLCTPPPERSNTFGRVTPHPAAAPSPLHPPEGIGTFGREWPSSPLAPDTLYRTQRKCLATGLDENRRSGTICRPATSLRN
jgi:hypothetical protein